MRIAPNSHRGEGFSLWASEDEAREAAVSVDAARDIRARLMVQGLPVTRSWDT